MREGIAGGGNGGPWRCSPFHRGPECGQGRSVQERLGHPATRAAARHPCRRSRHGALREPRHVRSARAGAGSPPPASSCRAPGFRRWRAGRARIPRPTSGSISRSTASGPGIRWGPVSSARRRAVAARSPGLLAAHRADGRERARIPEVERELRAQIDRAKSAGIRLSHLDSHMAHAVPIARAVRRVSANGRRRTVCRCSSSGRATAAGRRRRGSPGADPAALIDRVVSISPGVEPAGWMAAYEKLLAPLPPGVYQLIVHLAYDDEEMRGADAGPSRLGRRVAAVGPGPDQESRRSGSS